MAIFYILSQRRKARKGRPDSIFSLRPCAFARGIFNRSNQAMIMGGKNKIGILSVNLLKIRMRWPWALKLKENFY